MACPILLLADAAVAPSLRDHLFALNGDLTVACVDTFDVFETVAAALGPRVRVISFLTDVLVPGHVLARLSVEPINIHPGPPELPGAHPEVFAIWNDARQFGVTAHVMTAKVDAGDILYCRRFDIPARITRRDLGDLAFGAAVEAFRVVADHCAYSAAPMARTGVNWTGPKRRRRDLEAILANVAALDPDAVARLERASGAALRVA